MVNSNQTLRNRKIGSGDMLYVIDWSEPMFPRLRTAPEGDTLDVVAKLLINHHLEIIRAQVKAIERLLTDD